MAEILGNKSRRPRMFKHSGPPAAVIYMVGQNWFTYQASLGATNTLYPRHRYRLGASAGRCGYRPCATWGSGYLSYPWWGRSCSPTVCRLLRRCRRRVLRQPTTRAPVAGHWLPAGLPSSSARGHRLRGNERCSAR